MRLSEYKAGTILVDGDGKEYDEGWDGDNYHLVKKILKELEV